MYEAGSICSAACSGGLSLAAWNRLPQVLEGMDVASKGCGGRVGKQDRSYTWKKMPSI